MTTTKDIGVEKIGHVGLIEIQRPPLNFFDISLINQIADALEEFDRDIEIRASVLAAQGKAFCAGANFNDPARQEQEARAKADPASGLGPIAHLYIQAVRIFALRSRSSQPSMAPRSAAGWDWRCRRISASPAPRRALPPTSPSSAFIPASG